MMIYKAEDDKSEKERFIELINLFFEKKLNGYYG